MNHNTINSINCIDERVCYGCTLCKNACPKNAITMVYNSHGFLVPKVMEEKCIGCGLCLANCLAKSLYKPLIEFDNKVYGGLGKDEDRRSSSSGAIFPAIAANIVLQGGMVCGCILDDTMTARHVLTDDLTIIRKMSDSKYVQSELGNVYNEIALVLKNERKVLFSGTSCQVDGLLRYLKVNNQSVDKLLCIDLICHGVPSPMVFNDYLKFYETEKRTHIKGFKFRSKKYGWGDGIGACNYIQHITTQDGEDDSSFIARLWQNIFFSDLTTRECCFQCPYTTINKPADLTLGDFWGISSDMPELFDRRGTSLVITHNKKGEQALLDAGITVRLSSDYQKSIKSQSRLRLPVDKPDKYDSFWNDYSIGFKYLAPKYFKYSAVNKVKYHIKMKLYDMHLYKLANMLFKEIFF